MNEEDQKRTPAKATAEALVKVLSDQRRVLMTAGCNEMILGQYTALIRFLKSATSDELRRILADPAIVRKETEEPGLAEEQIADMPRADVQTLIDDESTPRKVLERIAIYRFRVPRGSMRSFSNRKMLVEKLSTLLRNEQTHATIENVARGQGTPKD